MDLRRRLAHLDRLTRKPATAGAEAAGELPTRRTGDDDQVPGELGLDRCETPAGPVWRRDCADAVPAPASPLPALAGLFTQAGDRRYDLDRVLFLDTETTGLAGGTGTLVFQLGLSWWDGGDLVTRQYFLPGPRHEAAMLAAVAEVARGFAVVVTYNGAAFDLPLLRTRALLNRLDDPLAHLAGWDLLVPARRLWGNRLADCRQQSVEAAVCDRRRGPGDIDGARIPQTWFDFLGDGRPGLLPNVLRHNRRDMVGMAEIFRRVCAVGGWLAGPSDRAALPGAAPFGWDDRAAAWSLGRLRERRREHEAAAGCYRWAWDLPWGVLGDEVLRRRFRRDAIRNLKRCRAWDLVEEVIRDGLQCDPDDAALHREAAILHEHRRVDLPRALRHAECSGDGHRVARLQRRLATGAGAPGEQKGCLSGEDDT